MKLTFADDGDVLEHRIVVEVLVCLFRGYFVDVFHGVDILAVVAGVSHLKMFYFFS